MIDIAERLEVDLEAEKEGVWEKVEGIPVRLARWGNPRSQRRFDALMKPHQYEQDRGTLPDEVRDEIINRVLAETIITDVGEDLGFRGEPLVATPACLLNVLSDPEMKDFRDGVLNRSQKADGYRKRTIEERAKNSETSSAGS